MKVSGATVQQLDKLRRNGREMPKSECRRWRLWATTEEGRKSKRFAGTYTQAQDALRAWVSELEGFVPCAETFGAYAESWAASRAASGDFAPNTIAKDARNVRALRRSPLDGMRMDEIGPRECRDALLWLKSHPERAGELSGSTMRTLHNALCSIFGQAASDGLVSANPLDSVRAPRDDTAERRALSAQELAALLDALDAMPCDAHVMALYLICCAGLRRGEALGVADSDVGGGVVRVSQAVKDERGAIGPPKSAAGARTVPMTARLAAKVDEWRGVRVERGLAGAPTFCCNKLGGVMLPQNLYKWWLRHRDALGCPGVSLHELRHSNLTLMARHMSPFDLQRWAGWSSLAPARVYIHDDFGALVRAAVDSGL